MKTCCWILSGVGVLPPTHCGRKLSYTMVEDRDTGRQRRDYPFYCPEHGREAAAQDAEDEEDYEFDAAKERQ